MIELYILLALAVLFFTKGWIFLGGLFLVLGVSRMKRKKGWACRSRLHPVFQEAQNQNVEVPKDHRSQKALKDLYDLYQKSRQNFPTLAEKYDDIMISLWSSLRGIHNRDEWMDMVLRVRKSWPQPQKMDIWDKLDEAKRAAHQFQESLDEADTKKWGPA